MPIRYKYKGLFMIKYRFKPYDMKCNSYYTDTINVPEIRPYNMESWMHVVTSSPIHPTCIKQMQYHLTVV